MGPVSQLQGSVQSRLATLPRLQVQARTLSHRRGCRVISNRSPLTILPALTSPSSQHVCQGGLILPQQVANRGGRGDPGIVSSSFSSCSPTLSSLQQSGGQFISVDYKLKIAMNPLFIATLTSSSFISLSFVKRLHIRHSLSF